MKRISLAVACVALLVVGCGTEDTGEPSAPEPAATEEADTGGMMDDDGLDY